MEVVTLKKSSKQPYYQKSKSKNKFPPAKKDPKVFEGTFFDRIRQTPVEFLIGKIKAGSDVESIVVFFALEGLAYAGVHKLS